MDTKDLSNPVVRTVVAAMREGDHRTFLAAFAPSAKLTDDGQPQVLARWADREVFPAHGRLEVEREDRDGLDLIGRFRSDEWDMKTAWKFDVANERVTGLAVAAL